ncbi:MAG: TonB-dependent receptor [Verrucomicrobia bacterium]|nr:TonB-dependent receptor [Verrucomicrobiota bacterium]
MTNGSTQKVLERATVSVVGTNLAALTAADGSFRLVGVPAGVQTVQIGYAGLEDKTVTVSVAPGVTATVEIALKSEVLQLTEFRVAGEREGNAYAIQQQKNAESQRTVVSADAFGVISDANPGEFLKLMPGIQMDYTGIEPRGLMVRGMEPNLNLVMINGNQAAAANSSSTGRTFEFDQITIDNIESIEVFKAPVPWMPANSIGGTVNMVTRSAFLQKGRRLNATLNLTGNTDWMTLAKTSGPDDHATRKLSPGGSISYSDNFLNGRLGVAASFSKLYVNGFGGTAYNTYTTNASGTFVSQYQREDHQNFTIRQGGSLNLDYKVSEATTVFLRTTYTDHYYMFRNRFLRFNTGTIVGVATPARVETINGNAEQNMSFGDKNNGSTTLNAGAKHRWAGWTVDYDAAYSRAFNHYDYLPRNFSAVTLRTSGVGYILEKDPARAAAGRLTQTAGADAYTLGNGAYAPLANSINVGDRSSVDKVTSGKGRVRREFNGERPFSLESGLSWQKQERVRQNPSKRWSYAGPDGIVGTADDTTAANMQRFAELEYTPRLYFGERGPNQWVSPFQLAKFYAQSPNAFVEDVANSYDVAFRNNQRIEEIIWGYYVTGSLKLGSLDVLAGLRVEETYVDGEGAKQNNAAAVGLVVNSLAYHQARLSRTSASTHYTPDPFKYLHLTWRANKQLQARASYSESIGRPNYGSIIPGISGITATTVTVANTALRPQRSENLDVSLEWYPGRTSSFTAAWFSKDIKDYIVNNTARITAPIPELNIGQDLVGLDLISSFNLGRAKVTGLELGGRYQLAFLPRALRGFEVFGNFTKLTKTEGNFNAGAAGTVYKELTNLAPKLWNLGFTYTTPNQKLYLKLLANFVDDAPINIVTREYKDSRTVYDAEVRYTLSPRYTLSLAGRNVTEAEEGQHFFDGRSTRTGTGGGTALTLTLAARF